MASFKIAFIGPPHSGKSILAASISTYFIDAQIDWDYVRTDAINGSYERILGGKEIPRKEFTEEVVKEIKEKVRSANAEVVISDAPGKITSESKEILREFDAFVLVHGDEEYVNRIVSEGKGESVEEWKQLAAELGKPIILEIETHYDEEFKGPYEFDEDLAFARVTLSSREKGVISHDVVQRIAMYLAEIARGETSL